MVAVMEAIKECTGTCKETLPLSEFYRHTRGGLYGPCKKCWRATVAARKVRKLDQVRATDRKRARRPEIRARGIATRERWYAADPRRMKAHKAVYRAVKKGLLTKLPCERCGEEKVHAHHDDYAKPLDVNWLCVPCHKERHKELAILGKEP